MFVTQNHLNVHCLNVVSQKYLYDGIAGLRMHVICRCLELWDHLGSPSDHSRGLVVGCLGLQWTIPRRRHIWRGWDLYVPGSYHSENVKNGSLFVAAITI